MKADFRGVAMLPAVASGTVAAICICAIATMIEPFTILNDSVTQNYISVMANINQFAGSFVGALVAGALTDGKRWLCASASVCLFYVTLLCVGVLFFENEPRDLLFGLLSCAAGVVCALLLLYRSKKPKSGKRIKHRSR